MRLSIKETALTFFRGWLWFLVFPLLMTIIIVFDYKTNAGQGLALMIAAIISAILGFKQIKKDTTLLRNKYLYNIICEIHKQARKNSESSFLPTLVPSDESLLGKPSNEFFWDYKMNAYANMEDFIYSFPYRTDYNAKRIKSAFTKDDMIQRINEARSYVKSIRIWQDSRLISVNYDEPIKIDDIISFEYTNKQFYQRGDSHTVSKTRHRGSLDEKLWGYGYKVNVTSRETCNTTYDPDRVIDDYTFYMTVRNNKKPVIKIYIGNNEHFVMELKSFLIKMGIPHEKMSLEHNKEEYDRDFYSRI